MEPEATPFKNGSNPLGPAQQPAGSKFAKPVDAQDDSADDETEEEDDDETGEHSESDEKRSGDGDSAANQDDEGDTERN